MLKQITLGAATAAMITVPSVALSQDDILHLAVGGVVHEVGIENTQGAAERLDAADRLRTLTQEVASAGCHLFNGISEAESRKLLEETKLEIIRILNALEFGDPDMGIIGEEHRRKTIADIHKVRDLWGPMEKAVYTLLDTPGDQTAIKVVKSGSDTLYEVASHLFSELSGEYANPFELTQLDALLIDIAGRQSMLTQRIAKEACEIWTGNRSDERMAALTKSVDTFQLGITALHDGMPALGIIPAPTEAIKLGLEEVVADWDKVREDLDAVIAGDPTDEIKVDLYTRLNAKMYKMDAIVHLYTAYAHHNN